jgi:hypothetical protein
VDAIAAQPLELEGVRSVGAVKMGVVRGEITLRANVES